MCIHSTPKIKSLLQESEYLIELFEKCVSSITFYVKLDVKRKGMKRATKEKMTRPYHFKKFDFPKGIPLQKSNFLKR